MYFLLFVINQIQTNFSFCLAVPTVIFVRTSRENGIIPRRYIIDPRRRCRVERTGNEIAHENAFYSVHRECLLAFYAFIPPSLPPLSSTNLIDRVPLFLLLLLFLLHAPPLVVSNDFSKARDSPTIFMLYRRWKTRAITATTTPDASSYLLSQRFSGPESRASFVGHLCSCSTGIHWWTAPSSCHLDSTRPPVQR